MSTRANKATPAGRSASRGIDFRPTISAFRIVLGHNKSRLAADRSTGREAGRKLAVLVRTTAVSSSGVPATPRLPGDRWCVTAVNWLGALHRRLRRSWAREP